jgi:hypothetical protein
MAFPGERNGRRSRERIFHKDTSTSQAFSAWKERLPYMKRQTLLGLLLAISAVMPTPVCQANDIVKVPEDNEPPFYARINGYEFIGNEGVFRTEEWAAIVFYRDPDCVPAGFNLLSFFDFSLWALPPAERCPLTIEGFEIWNAFPPLGPAFPIHTKSWGLGAVPIWFVAWPEMQALLADRVLTIGELESATTLLKGQANIYNETLHPPGGGLVNDAAQVGHINIDASGVLEDGRRFQFQAAVAGLTDPDCCFPDGKKQQVRIQFR